MKKIAVLPVLLISAFGFLSAVLPVKLSAEETPHRKHWEVGSDFGIGLANNLVGVSDILKKNIVIDLDKIAPSLGSQDAQMNMNLFGDAFFNLTLKEKYFLNFHTGIDGGINGVTSQAFIDLVTQGNINRHSSGGEIVNIFGAVFGEVGAGFKTKLSRFKLGGALNYYVPVIYIPEGKFDYILDAETGIKVGVSSSVKVYTPFKLGNSDNASKMNPTFDVGDLLKSGGVDVSLSAEYALFNFLDVGADIRHIPLIPATLKNEMYVSLENFKIEANNLLANQNIDMPKVDAQFGFKNDASFIALRPMRVDFYADYRPFVTNLLIVRPNIGFTAITPNAKGYFNAGLLLKSNLVRNIFGIHLGMGYDEGVWKNRLGLGFNFRVFEFLMEGSLRSQDFTKSFDGHGFGLTLGTRIGF
jgi:hypothetical protein